MTEQEALTYLVKNPDFLSISGSRLYGTNRESSDFDYRGFVIPPWEFIVGDINFNDTDVPGSDHKIYSLYRFVNLALQGDPQVSELFFSQEDDIVHITNVGREVMSWRDMIISKKIYRRIMGFGYSEWRKAEGVRLEIEKRKKNEDDVILDIRNIFKPDKADMDEIISILMKNKTYKKVPSVSSLGEKRKKDFEKFGYGVSSAVHAIRLTQQLAELMDTGNITFPRPNASLLKDIREGKYSFKEAKEIFEESRTEAEKAKEKSSLRESPDHKFVKKSCRKLVVNFLKNDERFNSV